MNYSPSGSSPLSEALALPDGRSLTTAAAIVLKSAVRDWHDLVSALTSSPPPDDGDAANVPHHEVRDLIRNAARERRFSERSEELLDSMLERVDAYSVVYFSKKQWRWLCDLAARAGL